MGTLDICTEKQRRRLTETESEEPALEDMDDRRVLETGRRQWTERKGRKRKNVSARGGGSSFPWEEPITLSYRLR
jgi:hypothetical protein